MEKTLPCFYIGIDPGKHGAMAIIGPRYARVFDWDDPIKLHMLTELCQARCPTKASIEHINARPGQNITSMFNMGKEVGRAIGWMEAHRIEYKFITPRKWFDLVRDSAANRPVVEKGLTGKNKTSAEAKAKRERKEVSLALARRLFPDLALVSLYLKSHHNRAEALLIAEALRRLDKEGNA
jgi:ribosomal protein L28